MRLTVLGLVGVMALGLTACQPTASTETADSGRSLMPTSPETAPTDAGAPSALPPLDEQEYADMIITVNGHALPVTLADNASARALTELLAGGDINVAMSDYGGFEKVGSLPGPLPTSDEQITTQPGDVILYQGDKLTIYYDTNSWHFTRLGRINGITAEELREALGEGDVTVTLSNP